MGWSKTLCRECTLIYQMNIAVIEACAKRSRLNGLRTRIRRVAIEERGFPSDGFEDEQGLAVFHWLGILAKDADDASAELGLDFVHHLHRLDDA
jgi:hypothetical protein